MWPEILTTKPMMAKRPCKIRAAAGADPRSLLRRELAPVHRRATISETRQPIVDFFGPWARRRESDHPTSAGAPKLANVSRGHRHHAGLEDEAVTPGQRSFVDSPVTASVETSDCRDLTAEQGHQRWVAPWHASSL